MSKVAVSAIIPTYNRAHLIDRAISSVLSQLQDEDELIVIDDGSTDDTEMVVAQFGDSIRYVRTSNHGVGAARNRGVKEAKNSLIAFLDSDDEWLPGKIKLQRAFMQAEPEILFCFSNHCFKNVNGQVRRFALEAWHDDRRSWEEILGPGKLISTVISLPESFSDFNYYIGDIYLSTLLYGNYLNVNTLMVWREQAGKELRFAEDVNIYEEWECLGRLARLGKCAYLDCETIRQISHAGPRLCSAGGFDRTCGKITVMERLWGEDTSFLEKHGELYDRTRKQLLISKAGGLMSKGRNKEAREELKKIPGAPLSHIALSKLPGHLTKGFLALKKVIKI